MCGRGTALDGQRPADSSNASDSSAFVSAGQGLRSCQRRGIPWGRQLASIQTNDAGNLAE
jgi:hypothetical protein